MRSITIYKITNTITGMIYIGFTERTLKERFDSHKQTVKRKPEYPLYAAMREYGIDKFTIEPIEELPPPAKNLYRREQHWISHYDCAYPHGYNADFESLKRLRGNYKIRHLTS